MIHFVTSTDRSYLLKTICLLRSFVEQRSAGWFCCFARDGVSEQVLRQLALPGVKVVGEADYRTAALAAVEGKRSPLEFACTAKPVLVNQVMDGAGAGDWVIWLDGDMFFFQPAERIVPEAPAASVLLTPHRFTPAFQHFEKTVGTFNGGMVGFRKSAVGRAALNWWAERCLEWCGAVPEEGRYADQKYLEALPRLFAQVHQVAELGINAAPWNAFERAVYRKGKAVVVAGDPLVLFHCQGLEMVRRRLFDLYTDGSIRLPVPLRRLVYRPYVAALRAALTAIEGAAPGFEDGMARGLGRSVVRPLKRWLLRQGNLAFI